MLSTLIVVNNNKIKTTQINKNEDLTIILYKYMLVKFSNIMYYMNKIKFNFV